MEREEHERDCDPAPLRPLLRGRLHQAAFVAAIPAGVVLVASARSTHARAAVAAYAVSLVALFGTSAAYHCGKWGAAARARMRRLDHAMIYVLIAGTYAPFSLLVLDGAWSVALLSVVGACALAGILIQLFAFDSLRVPGLALYIVMGWVGIVAAPRFLRTLDPSAVALVVAGGVVYTAGAVVLALGRPNPLPHVFGYHEVFHLATIVAGACHYASVLGFVVPAA